MTGYGYDEFMSVTDITLPRTENNDSVRIKHQIALEKFYTAVRKRAVQLKKIRHKRNKLSFAH